MFGVLTGAYVYSDDNSAVDNGSETWRLPYHVETCCLRPCQSVNTGVAQEHRVGKRHVNPGLGCGTFDKAPRTLQGDASLPRGHTGPVEGLSNGDVLGPNRGINQLFGVAAYRAPAPPLPSLYPVFATLPAKTLYEDR
jgi:hypothetical protein